MKNLNLTLALLVCLGGVNARAGGDFDSLRGASAQAVAVNQEPPDFPMPDMVPAVPQMPLPFMPPSDPHPFFTATCMAYCPYGFDTEAGPCTCYDPFSDFDYPPQVCEKICDDGSLPTPPCVCPGDQVEEAFPSWIADRGPRPGKAYAGTDKSLASILAGSATVICGGVEYPLFAMPMKCDMGSIDLADWVETVAAYYTYDAAQSRKQALKEEALKHLNASGNAAAAAAVAGRNSRIFSDGAALFVAETGQVAKISDAAAARRVYEKTFPRIVASKNRGDLGVHQAVVRGVLACMTSDACWGGLPAAGK